MKSGFVTLLLCSTVAWADGAFPDELAVFLPEGRPHEIVLVTNFGVLLSSDDGATFRYLCEQAITGDPTIVGLYQVDAQGSLYGAYGNHLGRSLDDGCTWQATQLPGVVFDVFPDRSGHVLAGTHESSSLHDVVSESIDHGATFTQLASSTTSYLLSFERSRAGSVLYVAGVHPAGSTEPEGPFLWRREDGEPDFTQFNHPDAGATSFVRIAQVDPDDANTLYLRVGPAEHDSLFIARDGGAQWNEALTLSEPMSAFLKAADGTVYVGTRANKLYVREPGAATFTLSAGPSIRCLGERDGVLFACADNFADGFALGRSTDHGQTWQPVVQFKQISGLLECGAIPTACAEAWASVRANFAIPDPNPPVKKPCGCTTDSTSPLAALAILLSYFRRRPSKN